MMPAFPFVTRLFPEYMFTLKTLKKAFRSSKIINQSNADAGEIKYDLVIKTQN